MCWFTLSSDSQGCADLSGDPAPSPVDNLHDLSPEYFFALPHEERFLFKFLSSRCKPWGQRVLLQCVYARGSGFCFKGPVGEVLSRRKFLPSLHESPLPWAQTRLGRLLCLWLWLQCFSWLPLEVCGENVANEHELSLCFSVPRYSILFHLFILIIWQFVEMLAIFFLSCLLTYRMSPRSAVCYLSLKHLSFHRLLVSLLPCDLSSLMSLRKYWFVYYPAFHVAIVWVRHCALASIIHLSRSLNSFPLSGRFSIMV